MHHGSLLGGYLLAFLATSAAAVMNLGFMQQGGVSVYPFLLFYPAIAATSFFGGVGPGLAATVLGAFYAYAFYLYPPTPDNWIALAVLGPLMATGFAYLRRIRDRNRAVARELNNFKLVGDHASDWILLLDDSLRIRYVNQKAATDLGWEDSELAGRAIESLIPETEWQTLHSAIGSAKPTEIMFERRDKSSVQMETGCTAVRTEEGQIIHVAARDVSERKEIARKLEEMRQWESLRVLAGGLAHDFNNLLTAILGNASLAQQTLPPRHEAAPMLEGIVKSAERSGELVQMMLAASGYRPWASETLQLDRLLDATLRTRPLPPQIRVAKEAEHSSFRGDRQTFETLLWSLISNAAESYGEEGGEVRVAIRRTANAESGPRNGAATFEEGDAGQGECLDIVVEDHGAGMPREVLDRAFNPFFSTKSTGRGLGLPAVRGIVRAYCGKLLLTTAVGQGTRVEVWLPGNQLDMRQ